MKNAYDIEGFIGFLFHRITTELKNGFECEDGCLDSPFFIPSGSTVNLGDAYSSPRLTSR